MVLKKTNPGVSTPAKCLPKRSSRRHRLLPAMGKVVERMAKRGFVRPALLVLFQTPSIAQSSEPPHKADRMGTHTQALSARRIGTKGHPHATVRVLKQEAGSPMKRSLSRCCSLRTSNGGNMDGEQQQGKGE